MGELLDAFSGFAVRYPTLLMSSSAALQETKGLLIRDKHDEQGEGGREKPREDRRGQGGCKPVYFSEQTSTLSKESGIRFLPEVPLNCIGNF